MKRITVTIEPQTFQRELREYCSSGGARSQFRRDVVLDAKERLKALYPDTEIFIRFGRAPFIEISRDVPEDQRNWIQEDVRREMLRTFDTVSAKWGSADA